MHLRKRNIISILNKKRRLFPLVGMLGIRQSAKSTILRDIVAKKESLPYFTLDRPEILKIFKSKPESFIKAETENFQRPIIIDEAQKAPKLFDVLKTIADEEKRRGMIILTGSVDFSKASGVKETLTGRIGLSKLYPFILSEIREEPYKFNTSELKQQVLSNLNHNNSYLNSVSKDIGTYLERGGMPSVCKISEEHERELIMEELLQSLCYRDLLQLKGARYDGAIARELLSLIAKNPEFVRSDFARHMHEDARVIEKHLQGLEALFAIYRITALAKSNSEHRFCIWDAGICKYLGALESTCLKSFIINQFKAKFEYNAMPQPLTQYYSSRGNTKIDLIFITKKSSFPLIITDQSTLSSAQLLSMKMLLKNNLFSEIFVAAPITQSYSITEKIRILPYYAFYG